jgi:hypothetical protein
MARREREQYDRTHPRAPQPRPSAQAPPAVAVRVSQMPCYGTCFPGPSGSPSPAGTGGCVGCRPTAPLPPPPPPPPPGRCNGPTPANTCRTKPEHRDVPAPAGRVNPGQANVNTDQGRPRLTDAQRDSAKEPEGAAVLHHQEDIDPNIGETEVDLGPSPQLAAGGSGQRLPPDCGKNRARGEGLIYLRVDRLTGKQYVGQAKSPERFEKRQREHNRKNPTALFIFSILEEEIEAGVPLSVAEEDWIRAGDGLRKEGGPLDNNRHEMVDDRYRANGGCF